MNQVDNQLVYSKLDCVQATIQKIEKIFATMFLVLAEKINIAKEIFFFFSFGLFPFIKFFVY